MTFTPEAIKVLMGELVGAAIAMPFGIKEISYQGTQTDLYHIAYALVGALNEEAIRALAEEEDPYSYGLLYRDPEDIANASDTPFGVTYVLADPQTKQRMLAFATIVSRAHDYICEHKGGFSDDM